MTKKAPNKATYNENRKENKKAIPNKYKDEFVPYTGKVDNILYNYYKITTKNLDSTCELKTKFESSGCCQKRVFGKTMSRI